LGRWDFGMRAGAGGADDTNNLSGAKGRFPEGCGEQRQSNGGRHSEDGKFEWVVEVEQGGEHAAQEKGG